MSMRVQYTIPGVEYASPLEAPAFDAPLSEPDRAPVTDWREVLGLNTPQPGDLVLSPPPKPASLCYSDAAEVRRQWASLMQRHTAPVAGAEARMLESLAWLREQEGDLQARILAEPKG